MEPFNIFMFFQIIFILFLIGLYCSGCFDLHITEKVITFPKHIHTHLNMYMFPQRLEPISSSLLL